MIDEAVHGAFDGIVAATLDAAVNPCSCPDATRKSYSKGDVRGKMEASSCPQHRDLARVLRYVERASTRTRTFYVASGLENIEEARRVVALLTEAGLESAYDWTTHGPVWMHGARRVREVSVLELDGVARADVVIVRLPGGRGTHVELGAALALKKPVIIYAEIEEFKFNARCCAFYHHPGVIDRVNNDGHLLALVRE